MYIAGSFTSWLNYTLNTTSLNIETTERFKTPGRMAKLVFDTETKSYVPHQIFRNTTERPNLITSEDDKSVNTVLYNPLTEQLVYGGDFPSQNNLGLYQLAATPAEELDLLIPAQDYGPPKPDSEFYDCLVDNGVDVVEGANFCCR